MENMIIGEKDMKYTLSKTIWYSSSNKSQYITGSGRE